MNAVMRHTLALGTLLGCCVLSAPSSASTNIGPRGTAGNDGVYAGWPDTTANLNDEAIAWNADSALHLDAGAPARAFITWQSPHDVTRVAVYHCSFNAPTNVTRDFQIQTLIPGGNPTADADWRTQVSVTGNASTVTTHTFGSPVRTQGARIYITNPGTEDAYSRIEEIQVFADPDLVANVVDYGAAGDGSTDDTSAIQAAIDSLDGGGTVVFPPGIYKTTSALSIRKDNIILRGTAGSMIAATGPINAIEVGPSTEARQFVGFEDLHFNPNGQVLDVIRFNCATHLCWVRNCRFEPVSGQFTAGYAINFNATAVSMNNNDSVDGCYFRWMNRGIKDGLAQVGLDINNCRFANVYGSAVEITSGGVAFISGCNFECCGAANTGMGIVNIGQPAPASQIGVVEIRNCHFETNNSNNVDIVIENGRSIRVIGNRFWVGYAPNQTGQAIECNNSTFVDVLYNEFQGFSNGSVDFNASNGHVTYMGNDVIDGAEFVGSGGNGIAYFGFLDGNFNLSLGDSAGTKAFAVKGSTGENRILFYSNGDIDLAGRLKINGTYILNTRQGPISNPTGGNTVDAESRNAINSILTALRNHGLISQ